MASPEIVRLRRLEWYRGMARRSAHAQAAFLLGLLFGMAGCAEPIPRPLPPAPAPTGPAPPPASTPIAAPVNLPASGKPEEKPVAFNDPPAPPDTPLCGRQAREHNAIGATLQGARVAASGICARFACYDPLTATYLGADGYRHVCR